MDKDNEKKKCTTTGPGEKTAKTAGKPLETKSKARKI